MNESTIGTSKVFAAAVWAGVAALLVAGWAIVLFNEEQWRVAGMLAASACAGSALAATFHVRAYCVRLCNLIRVANGLHTRPEAESLHSVSASSR